MATKTNTRLMTFLIIIGVLAIILSYLQLKGAIYAPFKQTFTREEPEVLDQAEIFDILADQDTDEDGLSDFDERFVYQTSVYIVDSDSDSFSDKEEVEAQSDPLNPESTPYHTPKTPEQGVSEQVFSPPEPDLSEQEVSIQEIRDLLINQAGLDKEIVDKLDDKTLENLYNETKQETGIDLRQLKAPDDLMRQFSDLDISQLRQVLIDQGVDQNILDSVDDETLRSMFLQSLLNLGLE